MGWMKWAANSINSVTSLVGAGLSASGKAKQAAAANKAAQALEAGATQAADVTTDYYNKSTGYLNPYIDLGTKGLSAYEELAGLSGDSTTAMNKLVSTPGYQFAYKQGLGAVQAGQAAQGLSASGSASKALTNYASGLASTNYQNILQDYMNAINSGQAASTAQAQNTSKVGSTLANLDLFSAQAKAAGITGNANALASMYDTMGGGAYQSGKEFTSGI